MPHSRSLPSMGKATGRSTTALQVPPIDGTVRAQLVSFLRGYLEGTSEAGGTRRRCYVVGLSGGIDSAVAAALAVEAVGSKRVLAVLLHLRPSGRDYRDATAIAAHLGIPSLSLPLGPVLLATAKAAQVPLRPRRQEDRLRGGNIAARLRMVLLYDQAANRGGLVLGSGNKSELLLGYFTKHGDGGVDLAPLGDLFKTQVRTLARDLGLPQFVVGKAPSAGLWPGQSDEQELGASYEQLDRALRGIELGLHGRSLASAAGVSVDVAARVEARVAASVHKRRLPLIPKVGVRTIGTDWRE